MNKHCRKHLCRQAVFAVLLIGGFWKFSSPVLAQIQSATLGGTIINNTATGTYVDPNNPGAVIPTSSNQVTVRIGEVAGVTITSGSPVTGGSGPGGAIQNNDNLVFEFVITNVGNDPTRFRIPNQASSLVGPIVANGNLEVSVNGGAFTPIAGAEVTTASVPAGGTVVVRVPVRVSGATGGEAISVKLGDTPGDAQNQPRTANGGDVYTVDNPDPGAALPPDPANEVIGVPSNGTREASFTQNATVGVAPNTVKAYATILKTASNIDNRADTNPQNDIVTYGLSLRVENTAPAGATYTPGVLTGTTLASLDGVANVTRILVSDTVPNTPAGLSRLTFTGDAGHIPPSAPPGWSVVYSTSNPATTTPLTATWLSLATNPITTVGQAAAVTRVGYVYNGTLAPGTVLSANAFSFSVITVGASTNPATPSTINNIAQVLGQTVGGQLVGGNPVLVYDESGDQRPSNFRDNGTPGPDTDQTPAQFNDLVTTPLHTGIPDPNLQGTDGSNANQGTDTVGPANPGGEVNQVVIPVPTNTLTVLTGPQGAPAAVGPNNNNDDFTNKAATPTDTTPGNTNNNPSPVAFTNSVRNTSTVTGTFKILPSATLPGATPTALTAALLPAGTTATISYGGTAVVYNWNGTTWAPAIPGTAPIQITLTAGASDNYGVEVRLPNGSRLSTDSTTVGDPGANTALRGGYPVPIVAFADNVTVNDTPDATEPQNQTIDRVYLGYLKLFKEVRTLATNGTTVVDAFARTLPNPNGAVTGNFLEYRITYTNITETAGAGNITLGAGNVVITDSGLPACGVAGSLSNQNNWAADNDGNGVIDTSNVTGRAVDSGAGSTITFFNGATCNTSTTDAQGTTINTDVTRYVNTLSVVVGPGESRAFTFRRRIN